MRVDTLSLSGYAVTRDWRASVLKAAKAGDTVYCGVSSLDFWRKLDPRVRLVTIDKLSEQDAVSLRYGSWLEWALVYLGVSRTEAKKLIASPPKTPRSRRYATFDTAKSVAFIFETLSVAKDCCEHLEYIESRNGQGRLDERVTEQPFEWTLVNCEAAVQAACETLEKAYAEGIRIGIDCETDVAGEKPNEMKDKLVGIGISIGKECFYGSRDYELWWELLLAFLPCLPFVAHNSKYDICVLRNAGLVLPTPLGDGRLAAYLLGVPEAGLKKLVYARLSYQMITYDEVVGMGAERQNISEVDQELVAEYCCADAYFGEQVEHGLYDELPEKMKAFYKEVELPLVSILVDMQFEGVPFDREQAQQELAQATETQRGLLRAIDALAQADGYVRPDRTWVCRACHNGKNKKIGCEECKGVGNYSEHQPVNPNSTNQLNEWLHKTCKLPIQSVSRATGKPSLDSLALLQMQRGHAAIPLILKYKGLTKYQSFLEQWLEASEKDGKLHTNYNNARVRSGRLSSQAPNLQQVSLPWRKMFIA